MRRAGRRIFLRYRVEVGVLLNAGFFKARRANTLVFDQRGIENILKPYEEEPEIDWYKVAVDTPILVKDSESEAAWKHRYFAKYVNGVVYTWMMGRTSWSADNDDDIFAWNIAKLAEEGRTE